MAKLLGLRVEPTVIHYTVSELNDETNEIELLAADTIKKPKALSESEALVHGKTQVKSIMDEYHVDFVGLKATENNAQIKSSSLPRFHMEGVIMELTGSSDIPSGTETSVNISKSIGFKSSQFKNAKDGTFDPLELGDEWTKLSVAQREALLASVSVAKKDS